MNTIKRLTERFLRWSEQYTKTDMVYLAQSGFWINLGSVTVSLLSLGLYMIFARTLSPETYGVYQYLLSAAALIGSVTLTGMNSAVIRGVAQGKEGTLKRAVSVQLAWGFIPLLIAFAIGAYYFVQGNALLGAGFLLIGLFTPVNSALNTYAAFLVGKKDFKRSFYYNFGINILFYAALALTALAVPFAIVLIAVNFVAQTIGLAFAYRATLRAHRPNDATDEETIKYGKHLSVMGVIGAVALQVDSLLVFQFLGAAPLALYAFATAIPDRLGGLFKFFPTFLLPALSTTSENETRRAVSWSRILWIILGLIVFGGLYAIFAPLLFAILFPAYAGAVPFSQLYALSMFGVVGQIFSTALVAQRKIRSLYIFSTVIPVVQMAVQFAGILLFGLWGIVVAKIISAWLPVGLSALLLFRGTSEAPSA